MASASNIPYCPRPIAGPEGVRIRVQIRTEDTQTPDSSSTEESSSEEEEDSNPDEENTSLHEDDSEEPQEFQITDSWMLILDYDDGYNQWQDYFFENFSNKFRKFTKHLTDCYAKNRLTKVATYGPGNQCLITAVDPNEPEHFKYSERLNGADIDLGLLTTVAFGRFNEITREQPFIAIYDEGRKGIQCKGDTVQIKKAHEYLRGLIDDHNAAIYDVCLSPISNGFFVYSSKEWKFSGYNNKGLITELGKKVNDPPVHVCESKRNWLVIRERSFTASKLVSEMLTEKLSEFFKTQRRFRIDRLEEVNAFAADQEVERQEMMKSSIFESVKKQVDFSLPS